MASFLGSIGFENPQPYTFKGAYRGYTRFGVSAMGDTILGIGIIRTMVFWILYWVPPYHTGLGFFVQGPRAQGIQPAQGRVYLKRLMPISTSAMLKAWPSECRASEGGKNIYVCILGLMV